MFHRIFNSRFHVQSETRWSLKMDRALFCALALSLMFNQQTLAWTDPMFAEQSNGEIRGYTEPHRSIELSSDETGAISKLEVAVGDFVQQGQIVARLDDRIQQSQLESARHLAESRGQIQAAEQAQLKRQQVFDLVKELQKKGGASQSEAVKAELELTIAWAKVVESRELIVSRELELQRAEIQLDRRWIRTPFAGTIAEIHREEGEFLSPLHPEILTLVQLDHLLALFNVPSQRMQALQVGQGVTVRFDNGQTITATVHSIGVETDAKSGTIPVKVKMDNRDGLLRSGEPCTLEF
jgi:RND family efflux transporter MFP subunit